MALQEDTLDNVIHDFGVYTDGVHILFDEDGLSDSDDEDYQQPLQEEATNMLKNLTQRQRQDIYQDLLQLSTNGILQRNSTTLIAAKYNVHVRIIQRVRQRAKNCLAQGIPVDVNSLRPKNCGRKKNQVDLTRVADIPLNRRGTIRSLAYGLQSSKSTVHRLFKEGMLRRHSNALRPYLKEENKQARLRWVLSKLDASTLPNNPKFENMKNIIHSDEKWFNGTQKNKTMYLHPDEEDPHRTVQNKNAICTFTLSFSNLTVSICTLALITKLSLSISILALSFSNLTVSICTLALSFSTSEISRRHSRSAVLHTEFVHKISKVPV